MITPPKHAYNLTLGCFATVATTPLFTSPDSNNNNDDDNSMTAAVADPAPSALHCTRPSSVPATAMANGHRDILGFLSTRSTSPLQSPISDRDEDGRYTYSLATPPASCGQQMFSTLNNGGGMRQCLDTSVLQPHTIAASPPPTPVCSNPVGSLLHHSVTISSPAAVKTGTTTTAAITNPSTSLIESSPSSVSVTFRHFSPGAGSPTTRPTDSRIPTADKTMASSPVPLAQSDTNREANFQRAPAAIMTALYPDLVPRPEGDGSRLQLPVDVLVPDSPRGCGLERRDYHNHLTDVLITLVDATGRVLYHRCHFLGQSDLLPKSFQPDGTCWREHVNTLDWELWEGHFAEAVEEGARWYALTAQINANQFSDAEADSMHHTPGARPRDRHCRLLLDCPIYRARLGERWFFVHTLSLPVQLSTTTTVGGDDPAETASDLCASVQLSCRTEGFCKPLIVHYHSILRECENEKDVISGNAADSLRKAMVDSTTATTVAWSTSSSSVAHGAALATAPVHHHSPACSMPVVVDSPVPVVRSTMTSELLLDSVSSSQPSREPFPASLYAMPSPSSIATATSKLQGNVDPNTRNIQTSVPSNGCSTAGSTYVHPSSPSSTGTFGYSTGSTLAVTSSTTTTTDNPSGCFSAAHQNTCLPPNRSLQWESSFLPSHMPFVEQQQQQQQQHLALIHHHHQQHPRNHYHPPHQNATPITSGGPNHTHHHHRHIQYVPSPDDAADVQSDKSTTGSNSHTSYNIETASDTNRSASTAKRTSELGFLESPSVPPVCQAFSAGSVNTPSSQMHGLRNGSEQRVPAITSSSSTVASSSSSCVVFVDKVATLGSTTGAMTRGNMDRLGALVAPGTAVDSTTGSVRVTVSTAGRLSEPLHQQGKAGGGKDQYGERIMRLQNLLPPEAIQRIRQIWQEIYGASKHTNVSASGVRTTDGPGAPSSATLREHFARRVRQVVRQYLGPNALVNLNRPSAHGSTSTAAPWTVDVRTSGSVLTNPPTSMHPPPPTDSVTQPTQVVSSPQVTPSIVCSTDQLTAYCGEQLTARATTASVPHQPTQSQAIARSLAVPPLAYSVPVACSSEPAKTQELKVNPMSIVNSTSGSPKSPSGASAGPARITSPSLAPPLELLPPAARRSSGNSQCCVLEWLLSDEADLCLLPPSFGEGKINGVNTGQNSNNNSSEGTVFMDMVSRGSLTVLTPSDTNNDRGALSIQLPAPVSSSGAILVSPVTPITMPQHPGPAPAAQQSSAGIDSTLIAMEPTENNGSAGAGSYAPQSTCSSSSSTSSGTSPIISSSPIHHRSGSLLVRLLHPSTPATMVSADNRVPLMTGSEPRSPDISLVRSDLAPRGHSDNGPGQHQQHVLTNARSYEVLSAISSPPPATVFYQPSQAGTTAVLLNSSDPRGLSRAKRRQSGPPTPLLNISSGTTASMLNSSSSSSSSATTTTNAGVPIISSRTRHVSQLEGSQSRIAASDGLTSSSFTSLTQLLLQDFPTTTATSTLTPTATTTTMTPILNGCQMYPGAGISDYDCTRSIPSRVSASPTQRFLESTAPRGSACEQSYAFSQATAVSTTTTVAANTMIKEEPSGYAEPIDRGTVTSGQLSDPYNRQQPNRQRDSTSNGPFSDPHIIVADPSAAPVTTCVSSAEVGLTVATYSPPLSTTKSSSGPAQSSLCRLLLDPQLGPPETSPVQTRVALSTTISAASTPLSPPALVCRARTRYPSSGNVAGVSQKPSGIDVYEFTATNASVPEGSTVKPIESPTGRSMFRATKTTPHNRSQPEQTFTLLNGPAPPPSCRSELDSTSSKVIAEEVEYLYEILRRDEMERSQDRSNEQDTGSPRPKRSRLTTPHHSVSDHGSVERNEWIDGEARDADWHTDDAQAVARICEQLQEGFTNTKPSDDPLPSLLNPLIASSDSRTVVPRDANFPEDVFMQTHSTTAQDFPTSRDYDIGCVIHHPSASPSSSSGSQPSGTQLSSSTRGSLNKAAVAAARASQQAAATQRSQAASQRLLVEQRKRLLQHQLYNQVTFYSPSPNCTAVPIDSEILTVSPTVVVGAGDPTVKSLHRNTRPASGSSPPRTSKTGRSMALARTRHASSSLVSTIQSDGLLLNSSSVHGLQLTVTTVVSMSTSPATVSSRSAMPSFYQHRPEDLPRYLKEVGPNVRVQLSSPSPAIAISAGRLPIATTTTLGSLPRPGSADDGHIRDGHHTLFTTPGVPQFHGVSAPLIVSDVTSHDARSADLSDPSGHQLYSVLTPIREVNSAEVVMLPRNHAAPTTATMTVSAMGSVASIVSPVQTSGFTTNSTGVSPCSSTVYASPVQSENSYTLVSSPQRRSGTKPSNSRSSKNGSRRTSTTRSGGTARAARATTSSTTSMPSDIVSSSVTSTVPVRIVPVGSESVGSAPFSAYKPITPAPEGMQASARWNLVNTGANYTSSAAVPVSQIIAARTNSVCVGDGYVLGYVPIQEQYPPQQMYLHHHHQQQQQQHRQKQLITQQAQLISPDLCIVPSGAPGAVPRPAQSPSTTTTTPQPSLTPTFSAASPTLPTQSAFLYPIPTTGTVTQSHLLLPVQTSPVVAHPTQFYVLPSSQASAPVLAAISPVSVAAGAKPQSVLSPRHTTTNLAPQPTTTPGNLPPSIGRLGTPTRFDDRCPRQTTSDLLMISDSDQLDAMFDVDSKLEENLLPDDIIDDVFGLETMVAAKQQQQQQQQQYENRQNFSVFADTETQFAHYSPAVHESDTVLHLHGLPSNASSSPSPCSPHLTSTLPADIRS